MKHLLENKDIRNLVPTIYGDWNHKFGALWSNQLEQIKAKFPRAIIQVPVVDAVDIPVVTVSLESAHELIRHLKDHGDCKYTFLTDYTATDEEVSPRFRLVFQLMNIENKSRIRVKILVDEGQLVPTFIPFWSGANWAEREIWDMFGIAFEGHPDLRRIIMDQRWEGHPLRKDYPLKGYQVFLTPEPIDEKLLND